MIAVLKYELVRIRTVRSTWIALILAFVLPLGLGYLIASPSTLYSDSGEIVGEGPGDWFGAFAFPLALTAVVASVVASQAIGQEYRFGIIRLTLTAFPRRLRVLLAKLLVVAAAGVVLVLVSFAGSWLAVTLRGHPSPPEALDGSVNPDAAFFLRGAVFVVLWAFSAFALAGITRQTAVGIAVPIVSGLIVENILQAVLYDKAEWLMRILPWSTASRWSGGGGPDFGGDPLPGGWAALAIFGAWVLAFLLAHSLLFLRRDA
jgi:ABC-type transport system involved in multi-copper enzyme maturation permease subunit